MLTNASASGASPPVASLVRLCARHAQAVAAGALASAPAEVQSSQKDLVAFVDGPASPEAESADSHVADANARFLSVVDEFSTSLAAESAPEPRGALAQALTSFLAQSLLASPRRHAGLPLSESALISLTQTLLGRLEDSVCTRQTLEALRVLVLTPRFVESGGKEMGTTSLCARVLRGLLRDPASVPSLPQAARRVLLDAVSLAAAAHPDVAVAAGGSGLLRALCAAVDGEKDPRTLVAVFDATALLLQLLPDDALLPLIVEVFENLSCYFPITFASRGTGADPEASPERIRASLRTALASTPLLAPYVIPFLVDKMSGGAPATKIDSLRTLRFCAAAYGGEALVTIAHPAPLREILRMRARGRCAGALPALPASFAGSRAASALGVLLPAAAPTITPALAAAAATAAAEPGADGAGRELDPLAVASGRLTFSAAQAARRALRAYDAVVRPAHEALAAAGVVPSYEVAVADAAAGLSDGDDDNEAEDNDQDSDDPCDGGVARDGWPGISPSAGSGGALSRLQFDPDETPEPLPLRELWHALRRDSVFATDSGVTAQGVLALRGVVATLCPDGGSALWPLLRARGDEGEAKVEGESEDKGGCCGGKGKGADKEEGGCCGGKSKASSGCCKSEPQPQPQQQGCCGGKGDSAADAKPSTGCCGGSKAPAAPAAPAGGGCCGGGGCGSGGARGERTLPGLLSSATLASSSFAPVAAAGCAVSSRADAFLLPLLSDCVSELRIPDATLGRAHARALVLGPLAASRAAVAYSFPHLWAAIKAKWGAPVPAPAADGAAVCAEPALTVFAADDPAQGLVWPTPGAPAPAPPATALPVQQRLALVELVGNLWFAVGGALTASEAALSQVWLPTVAGETDAVVAVLPAAAGAAVDRLAARSRAHGAAAKGDIALHPLQSAAQEAVSMLLGVLLDADADAGAVAAAVTAAAIPRLPRDFDDDHDDGHDEDHDGDVTGAAAAAGVGSDALWARWMQTRSVRAAALMGLRALLTAPDALAFAAGAEVAPATAPPATEPRAPVPVTAAQAAALTLPAARQPLLPRPAHDAAVLATAGVLFNISPGSLAVALAETAVAAAAAPPALSAPSIVRGARSIPLPAAAIAALSVPASPLPAPPATLAEAKSTLVALASAAFAGWHPAADSGAALDAAHVLVDDVNVDVAAGLLDTPVPTPQAVTAAAAVAAGRASCAALYPTSSPATAAAARSVGLLMRIACVVARGALQVSPEPSLAALAASPSWRFSQALVAISALSGSNPLLLPLAGPLLRFALCRMLPEALDAQDAAATAEDESSLQKDALILAPTPSPVPLHSSPVAAAASDAKSSPVAAAVAILAKPLTPLRAVTLLLTSLTRLMEHLGRTHDYDSLPAPAPAPVSAAAASLFADGSAGNVDDAEVSLPGGGSAVLRPQSSSLRSYVVGAAMGLHCARMSRSAVIIHVFGSLRGAGARANAASLHVQPAMSLLAAYGADALGDTLAVFLHALVAAAPADAQAREIAAVTELFLRGDTTPLARHWRSVAAQVTAARAGGDCDAVAPASDDDEDMAALDSLHFEPLRLRGDADPETDFSIAPGSAASLSSGAEEGGRVYPMQIATGAFVQARHAAVLVLMVAAARPAVRVPHIHTLMTTLVRFALSMNGINVAAQAHASATAQPLLYGPLSPPHYPWLCCRYGMIALTVLMEPGSPMLTKITTELLPYLIERARADRFRHPSSLPEPLPGAPTAAAAAAEAAALPLAPALYSPNTEESQTPFAAYCRSAALKTAASLLHALVQRCDPEAPALVAKFASLGSSPDFPAAATASSAVSPAGGAGVGSADGRAVSLQHEVDARWRLAGQAMVALSALGSPRFFSLAALNFSPSDVDFIRHSQNFLASVAHFSPQPFAEHKHFATTAPLLASGPAEDAVAASAGTTAAGAPSPAEVERSLRQLSLAYLVFNTPASIAAPALPTLVPALVDCLRARWGALSQAAVAVLERFLSLPQSASVDVATVANNHAHADAAVLRRALVQQHHTTFATVLNALAPHMNGVVRALCDLATATGARATAPTRVSALTVLRLIAEHVPMSLLAPLKEEVHLQLEQSLDDKKVVVRQAAVQCRARWFLVGGTPKRL